MSDKPLHKRKGSLLGTVKAVLWGFLGVRRNADYQDDIAKLNPVHLVVVGLIMALLFVFILIFVVKWVVS
ncbi:hypothetical protein LPB72_05455 [Hydrogenophaga crassostreae]|uniref:DUF2970 domain-containing protein n=1 Tax=Hydrogenophaga crassostreae TaxID=1763535 RepID=A0A167IPE9_9BURK|nr:DUF2970 domain-containing protein [Hydrogenophaga crassostreae]AOW14617.1 hypothetical protein LPB072_19095 [Hydrogenophaga crassostreae]OAD43286.1 hypothetical protein LPB72_05455 [Hydrogenophaga crassostreae]